MKNVFKRCIAIVLVLAMSLSGTVSAFAAPAGFESDSLVPEFDNAVELKASEDYELATDLMESFEEKFDISSDSEVTFIVELEGESVLEEKPEDLSVSEYLESSEAEKLLSEIVDEQKDLEERIKFNGYYEFDVKNSYQVIMNGVAVTAPYGAKAYLESLSGVKAVYVSNVYETPETIATESFMGIGSGELIESDEINAEGYTGKGTVVAVIDTGVDIFHEAFSNAPEDPTLSEEDIANILETFELNAEKNGATDGFYVSEKIPFVFNYYDESFDVSDVEVHGTHVAGTVAADCATFRGVAPDAQIVVMKVFSETGGAPDTAIFPAIEDAVILGVDAINMSIGRAGGFSYEDELTDKVFSAVKNAGINLYISAGNDTSSNYMTEGIGYAKTSEPDSGIVGACSTYSAAVSVASVNERKNFTSYVLLSDGSQIQYTDSNLTPETNFVTVFNGQELEYVVVPGLGKPEDFAGVDVTGKLALVKRGEIAFTEKEANAAAAGAIGMIVYDNVYGSPMRMQVNGIIPSICITLYDGEKLLAQENKTIKVSAEYWDFLDAPGAGLMSDFSSIGPTPDLSIKPEITAPGGYVFSSLPDNSYGTMDGTSMSTPHVAGAAAVMQQYVDEKFPELSEVEKQEFINSLLMGTAEIVLDEEGVPYSVRKQGAGLAKISNAVKTEAYVSVEGSERPKAEIGDSIEGKYGFEITVHNFGESTLTYYMDSVSLTSHIFENAGEFYMLEDQMILSEEDIKVVFSQEEVIVPAGGEVTVEVEIALTDSFKEYMDYYFENGNFVEGYIVLVSGNDDGIDLSVPYLGFYGDWGQASIFDNTIYDDEAASAYTGKLIIVNGEGEGAYAGMNMFTGRTDINKIAASAVNMEGGYLPVASYGLVRGAKTFAFNVTNEEGETVDIFDYNFRYGTIENLGDDYGWYNVPKSFYHASSNSIFYMTGPADDAWLPVEEVNGTLYYLTGQYYINAVATVDGTDSHAGTQKMTYPIYFDHSAPEVIATRHDEVDGEHYVTFALYDSHYVMGMQLANPDTQGAYTSVVTFDDMVTEKGDIISLTYNVTDLVNAGIESMVVFAVDYALNESVSYEIKLAEDTTPVEEIVIENNVAYAFGAKTFEIEAYIEPSNILEDVAWTSSDEKVATVVANGIRYDEETGRYYYRALVSTNETFGKVTITATASNGLSASTEIEVFSIANVFPGLEWPELPELPEKPEQPERPEIPNLPNHPGHDDSNDGGFVEKEEDEVNPETGASVNGVSVLGAVAVLACTAVVLKKQGK